MKKSLLFCVLICWGALVGSNLNGVIPTVPYDDFGDHIGEWVYNPERGYLLIVGASGDGYWVLDVSIGTHVYHSRALRPYVFPVLSGVPTPYAEISGTSPIDRYLVHAVLRYWVRPPVLRFAANNPPGYSFIPAGTFHMGSPTTEVGREADEVYHGVRIKRKFFLKQKTVTKAEWDEVRLSGKVSGYSDLPQGRPGHVPSNDHSHPVTFVSWYDVLKWLNKKSQMEELKPCYYVGNQVYKIGQEIPTCNFNANGYRLPTEAEWEYACRAGTTTAFYNGGLTNTHNYDPNLEVIGWYYGNAGSETHVAGQKKANPWRLHDMLGNVKEHCFDHYGDYVTISYNGWVEDPVILWTPRAERTVLRGGGYTNHPRDCRSAERASAWRWTRGGSTGFRPARTANP